MKECDYCRICGGFVDYDKSTMLYSYPPQYKGICSECGTGTTEYCYKVDGEEDYVGPEM